LSLRYCDGYYSSRTCPSKKRDYLIGKTKMEVDANTMRRLEDISSLSEENKKFVLNMIDMALRDFKTKKAYSKRFRYADLLVRRLHG
jgi:hypothetical protein